MGGQSQVPGLSSGSKVTSIREELHKIILETKMSARNRQDFLDKLRDFEAELKSEANVATLERPQGIVRVQNWFPHPGPAPQSSGVPLASGTLQDGGHHAVGGSVEHGGPPDVSTLGNFERSGQFSQDRFFERPEELMNFSAQELQDIQELIDLGYTRETSLKAYLDAGKVKGEAETYLLTNVFPDIFK